MGYNNSTMASYQNSLQTLEGLRDFVAAGRNKTSRTLANNTTARILNDAMVAIKLHQTDILIFTPNTVTLNSGGWLSVTTKERINRYTNAGISQKNGVWYMSDGSLFYDGMVVKNDGTPVAPRKTDKYEKQLKAIKRDVKAYAKKYVEALKAGLIDMPSGGDCWACAMRPVGDQSGATVMGASHLRDHMAENYFVPSLLVNAGRAAGYQDFQIGMMGIGGHKLFIDPERNIYRYMVKQLQQEIK